MANKAAVQETVKSSKSNTLPTSEDQDAKRRAAKSKHRKANNGQRTPATSTFGAPANQQWSQQSQQQQGFRWNRNNRGAIKSPFEIQRDQAIAKQRAKEADQQASKEAAASQNRQVQADRAIASTNVTTLKKGSLARKVAEEVIKTFPSTSLTVVKDGPSRTTLAITAVQKSLTRDEAKSKAYNLGVTRARHALNWAFHNPQ